MGGYLSRCELPAAVAHTVHRSAEPILHPSSYPSPPTRASEYVRVLAFLPHELLVGLLLTARHENVQVVLYEKHLALYEERLALELSFTSLLRAAAARRRRRDQPSREERAAQRAPWTGLRTGACRRA